MKKIIVISNVLTLFILGYYAIKKGLDGMIAIALITSILSNILNIVCEVKSGKKD